MEEPFPRDSIVVLQERLASNEDIADSVGESPTSVSNRKMQFAVETGAQYEARDTRHLTVTELQDLIRNDVSQAEVTEKSDSLKIIESRYGDVRGLLAALSTSEEYGLRTDVKDIKDRQMRFGKNEISAKSTEPFWKLALSACNDQFIQILGFAATVTLIISMVQGSKDYLEAIAIYVAILLVVLIGAFMDYKKEKEFKALNDQINSTAKSHVIRNGKLEELLNDDLVVGDVVVISTGVMIPADGLLLSVQGGGSDDEAFIEVDESSLTGESRPVKKTKLSPVLLSHTNVQSGKGVMVLLAVGRNSERGKIAMLLGGGDEDDLVGEGCREFCNLFMATIFYIPIHIYKGLCIRNISGCAKGEFCPKCRCINRTCLICCRALTCNQCHCCSKSTRHALATCYCCKCCTINFDDDDASSDDDDPAVSKSDSHAGKNVGVKAVTEKKSVMQLKLEKVASLVTKIGIICALIVIAILFVTCWVEIGLKEIHNTAANIISHHVEAIIAGIAILVMAIPEGLPLAVTLAMAFSVRRMMSDNCLVRHMNSSETMGNATTICTDKTGTLTTNQMMVVQAFIGGVRYVTPDAGSAKVGVLDEVMNDDSGQISTKITYGYPDVDKNREYLNMLVAATDDTSTVTVEADGRRLKMTGNRTECAILAMIDKMGLSHLTIRKEMTPYVQHVYLFDSRKKYAGVVLKKRHEEAGFNVVVKGATEKILHRCSHFLTSSGAVEPFDDHKQSQVMEIVKQMAGGALRTLAIALREFVENQHWASDEEAILVKLTLIAVIGIQDPLRPEVTKAIEDCKTAGIVVRMVTGDNVITARAIALSCGILTSNDDDKFSVMTSAQFNAAVRKSDGDVDQEKFDSVWPRLRVLARALPEDKYILVDGIIRSKQGQEIVAVTGDGTNDAPALKRADVGFAMGIQGTDVAKGACDIIISDDNFNSIVKAVMWGRNVYDSVCKFLQFQLTVNVVALLVSLIGVIFLQVSPLKAIQMLYVNLVMDTFASIALATDKPTDKLLRRPPRGRTTPILSAKMIRFIVLHSILQLAILMTIMIVFGTQFNDFSQPNLLSRGQCPTRIEGGAPANQSEFLSNVSPEESLCDYSGGVTASSCSIAGQEMVPCCGNCRGLFYLRGVKLNPCVFVLLYNAFIFMTLANMINTRGVYGEANVFAGLSDNLIFVFIWLLEVIVHVVMVEYGGSMFNMLVEPLTGAQWCVSVVPFFIVLIWHQLVIRIPIDRWIERKMKGRRISPPAAERPHDTPNLPDNQPPSEVAVRMEDQQELDDQLLTPSKLFVRNEMRRRKTLMQTMSNDVFSMKPPTPALVLDRSLSIADSSISRQQQRRLISSPERRYSLPNM